jgi:hypothetical protein
MSIRVGVCFTLLSALLATEPFENAANAAVTVVGTVASLEPAGIGIAAGGSIALESDNWWGRIGGSLLAAGALASGIVDPPGGTIYSGEFEFHYPANLMVPVSQGWLGDWGQNPSLPAPPVNPNDWGTSANPTIFKLQAPNAGLSSSFSDNGMGVQTITFDWGPSGHAESEAGAFNFFASEFRMLTTVHATYLGNASSPLPGADFFVSVLGGGFPCKPTGGVSTVDCGETTTSYFAITQVPEPSSGMLLAMGAVALLGFLRSKKKTSRRCS